MLREIITLIYKELLLEWKQRYAFNGLLLYVISMVVVISLAFAGQLSLQTWNILFWIMILFVAVNAVAKSFMAEQVAHLMYLYGVARPASVMIAKIIYNTVLMALIALLTLGVYIFLSQQVPADPAMMAGIVVLGSSSFAANLTLISAIAARADNSTTLLAVLSFPLTVPVLLLLIRYSRYAIEGLAVTTGVNNLWYLAGITLALAVASVLLYPFVWRE
ncbi:MAG: heme exporter protein CcmB [Bacteroidia bacterium]|nr:heme exporter protein CcmB [Bacteroidia bacterium]